MIHDPWYHKVRFSSAREASCSCWNHFPHLGQIPPHGAQSGADGWPSVTQICQKVEKIVSESPSKSDAGKNRVSDRLKHRKHSSRAGGAIASARAENHRKVSKTMPEGIQKRHRTLKKRSRNVSEITWQNHASKNRKMSPKRTPNST